MAISHNFILLSALLLSLCFSVFISFLSFSFHSYPFSFCRYVWHESSVFHLLQLFPSLRVFVSLVTFVSIFSIHFNSVFVLIFNLFKYILYHLLFFFYRLKIIFVTPINRSFLFCSICVFVSVPLPLF